MAAEKAEGLILRVTDFSETSRIVVIMTREFGKISALAKGGRRLKGPFESALDLLATCQIVFLRKNTSGLDLLTEAKLITRFRPHDKDLTCLYSGYYVAELLLDLTEDYDPHPDLYAAAQAALESFANPEFARIGLLRFELTLLREIGQLPDFDNCSGCGTRLQEGKPFGYSVAHGGLICPDCKSDEPDQIKIHAGTAAALRLLSSENEDAWKRLVLSQQQLREMKHLTSLTLSYTMGRRPKMLKYLS